MKLLVLQGPPACGKTTWAREFIKGKKDWVIVNRDSIRNGRGDYWIPEQEGYISSIEDFSIKSALTSNLNVIIDATNLNPKTIEKWKNISEECKAEIEFKEFYIPFEEAVERDSKREQPVGKKVIKRFYRQYYLNRLKNETEQIINHKRLPIDSSVPKAVICDVDGTIAWMQGRSPYDYTKISEDIHDPRLLQLLQNLQEAEVELIFVSGREGNEQCVKDTIEWLTNLFPPKKKLNVWNPSFMLFQRKKGDYRPDEIIKEEIYHQEIEGKFDIIAVFDDRNKVVNMWRNLNLLCLQVNNGDF